MSVRLDPDTTKTPMPDSEPRVGSYRILTDDEDCFHEAYHAYTETKTVTNGVVKYYLPGEPIFTLRAQDVLAPSVVEAWAFKLEAAEKEEFRHSPASAPNMDGVLEEFKPSKKVRDARALAHDMRAWQERNHKKVPD